MKSIEDILAQWDTPDIGRNEEKVVPEFKLPPPSNKKGPVVYLNNQKRCIRCQQYFEANNDNFGVNKARRDGMNDRCYDCAKAHAAENRKSLWRNFPKAKPGVNKAPPRGYKNILVATPWGSVTIETCSIKLGVPPTVIYWAMTRNDDLILTAARYRGMSHEQLRNETTRAPDQRPVEQLAPAAGSGQITATSDPQIVAG